GRRRRDVIRQLEAYAQQQQELQHTQASKVEPEASSKVDGVSDDAQLQQEADDVSTIRRQALERSAHGGSSTGGATGAETPPSGDRLHTEAVDAASAQQDVGERWMSFRDSDSSQLPTSVEEAALGEKQRAQDEQQQAESISVQSILNQHKINNGIPG
ncbi:MAG: hypothetical protein AAFZ38_10270, partial [Myxococcota bacterium]